MRIRSPGEAYGELAATLARFLTSRTAGMHPGRRSSSFSAVGGSAFEMATRSLCAFELAEASLPPKASELQVGHYRLTVDADAMPEFLNTRVEPDDWRVPDLLASFVCTCCVHDFLSDDRSWFVPKSGHEAALESLAYLGHAQKVDSRYRWTDRLGPIMQANGLWNSRLQSLAALERDAITCEAELAWRTMPESIRRRYFTSRPIDMLAFTRLVALSWREGEWHRICKPDAFWTGRDQVPLAYRIVELADRDPSTA